MLLLGSTAVTDIYVVSQKYTVICCADETIFPSLYDPETDQYYQSSLPGKGYCSQLGDVTQQGSAFNHRAQKEHRLLSHCPSSTVTTQAELGPA